MLRELRQKLGLTQEQLAERSGIDQTTISTLERDSNANPTWDTVSKIARALGVDPQEIFPMPSEEASK